MLILQLGRPGFSGGLASAGLSALAVEASPLPTASQEEGNERITGPSGCS
jgi:hypothetical protein